MSITPQVNVPNVNYMKFFTRISSRLDTLIFTRNEEEGRFLAEFKCLVDEIETVSPCVSRILKNRSFGSYQLSPKIIDDIIEKIATTIRDKSYKFNLRREARNTFLQFELDLQQIQSLQSSGNKHSLGAKEEEVEGNPSRASANNNNQLTRMPSDDGRFFKFDEELGIHPVHVTRNHDNSVRSLSGNDTEIIPASSEGLGNKHSLGAKAEEVEGNPSRASANNNNQLTRMPSDDGRFYKLNEELGIHPVYVTKISDNLVSAIRGNNTTSPMSSYDDTENMLTSPDSYNPIGMEAIPNPEQYFYFKELAALPDLEQYHYFKELADQLALQRSNTQASTPNGLE